MTRLLLRRPRRPPARALALSCALAGLLAGLVPRAPSAAPASRRLRVSPDGAEGLELDVLPARWVYRQLRVVDAETGAPVFDPEALQLRDRSRPPGRQLIDDAPVAWRRRDAPIAVTFVVDLGRSMEPALPAVRDLVLATLLSLDDDDRVRIVPFGGSRPTPFATVAAFRLRAAVEELERRYLDGASPEERSAYEQLDAAARAATWMSQLPERLPDEVVTPLLAGVLERQLAVAPVRRACPERALGEAVDGLVAQSDANLGLVLVTKGAYAESCPIGGESASAWRDPRLESTFVQQFRVDPGWRGPLVSPRGDVVTWGLESGGAALVPRLVAHLENVHEVAFSTRRSSLADGDTLEVVSIPAEGRHLVAHPPRAPSAVDALLGTLGILGATPRLVPLRDHLLEEVADHPDARIQRARRRILARAGDPR